MSFYYELKIMTNNVASFTFIQNLLAHRLVKHAISLPQIRKRFVILKSPHVNNKSKEHFQSLQYIRLFVIRISPLELSTFLLNAPHDISLRVRRLEKQIS
jgi:ribosomal protein S10